MKALKNFRTALTLSALLVTAAVAAPAANAGLLVQSASGCATQSTSKPFSKWGDTNNYFLASGGSFESGSAGWTLSGGAKVVSGNEPFNVGGAGSHSLYIPQGGYATSPTICVGVDSPSIRWFSKQQSLLNLTGAMTVEVATETSLGAVVWLPAVGAGLLNSTWNPSLPAVVESALLPLLPGQKTPVQFRFRAVTGNWTIDDVYVDPFSRW